MEEPGDPNHEKFRAWLQNMPDMAEIARKENFPHGRPICYSEGLDIIREWPDGRKEVIGHVPPPVKIDNLKFTLE